MKCAKCGYLGFEQADRCRNCGYDYSLASTSAPDLDRVFGAPEPAAPPRIVVEPTLFGPPIPDDEPLITRASPPRPPLAVRRATPEAARLRAEPRVQSLELE